MFSADLGVTPSAANYIEDVFSTYLYTGNGSTGQTITNGIDLSGKGGMVWIKSRSNATKNTLSSTASSNPYKYLSSNSTDAESTSGYGITSFNSSGFFIEDVPTGTNGFNGSGYTYASWTFRKQAKFFDIVTYTGTGANRTIAHNLGSVPGCIMIKRADTTAAWAVYHRSLANTQYMVLNTTAAAATGATYWNSTTPTSSVFSLGTSTDVNASGGTYVAYIFASFAGGFGATGTDEVISCGAFTTNASGVATVTLGYEPQWILTKRTDAASPWLMRDNMRGWTAPSGAAQNLRANLANAEDTTNPSGLYPTATGFSVDSAWVGATSAPFIYIAIRRGPMKTPTTGTSVFMPAFASSSGGYTATAGFPVDSVFYKNKSAVEDNINRTRLLGGVYLVPNTTAAQVVNANGLFDSNTAYYNNISGDFSNYINWMFRRAPGFFDVVCYTSTGSAVTLTHNLGVAPELVIFKCRSTGLTDWLVYWSAQPSKALKLNGTDAIFNEGAFNNTAFTSTSMSLALDTNVNSSTPGTTYVSYLFASVPGVSKIGSYTGTGTTNQINCGFTGGARFVLIKRTDSTGDWYVWDSARGIVAGNDPYLLLNSTAAEVTSTDYVDTYSAGFEISSTAPAAINANGGTFIFLAIA